MSSASLAVRTYRLLPRRAFVGAFAAPRAAAAAAFSSTPARPAPPAPRPALEEMLTGQLDDMHAAGTYKHERVITTPQTSSISVEESDVPVINFCANNYLGLSNHPDLIAAAKDTLDSHGFGLSSVRFICGTQDIHKQLEDTISRYHGMDDTILFPSCFDANAGLFEAILTDEDAVISDALNHASIIDGIRLCKARRHRYDHLG